MRLRAYDGTFSQRRNVTSLGNHCITSLLNIVDEHFHTANKTEIYGIIIVKINTIDIALPNPIYPHHPLCDLPADNRGT